MAAQVTNYQCPACTGPVHFSPETGKVVCDYCGSVYELKEIEKIYAEKEAMAAEAMADAEEKEEVEDEREGRLPSLLTTKQVDEAIEAGAKFIVSPGLNPKTVKYCIEKNVPITPGTSSPSDIEQAIELGLDVVKFFPAEAAGGLKMLKAMAAPYGQLTFMPTGGINADNLLDYLKFNKIVACGGSWMVPADAVANKDWKKIEDLTRSAVNKMLGLEIKHIGVNSGSPERSMKDAEMLSKLLGWPIDEHKNANFVGEGFEVMKVPFRGTHGHIAVACNSIKRARWHMERRGFEFDDESAIMKDGKLRAIYLKDEIAGFAIHLLQK